MTPTLSLTPWRALSQWLSASIAFVAMLVSSTLAAQTVAPALDSAVWWPARAALGDLPVLAAVLAIGFLLLAIPLSLVQRYAQPTPQTAAYGSEFALAGWLSWAACAHLPAVQRTVDGLRFLPTTT